MRSNVISYIFKRTLFRFYLRDVKCVMSCLLKDNVSKGCFVTFYIVCNRKSTCIIRKHDIFGMDRTLGHIVCSGKSKCKAVTVLPVTSCQYFRNCQSI